MRKHSRILSRGVAQAGPFDTKVTHNLSIIQYRRRPSHNTGALLFAAQNYVRSLFRWPPPVGGSTVPGTAAIWWVNCTDGG